MTSKGSELFEAIVDLDEYYLPDVETRDLLGEHRDEICATIGKGKTLVEPGAGSCEKVKWLLPELEPDCLCAHGYLGLST